METHNQNDQSVTNQVEYNTGLRQDYYFLFFVSLLSRQGPALKMCENEVNISHANSLNV